MVWAGYAKKHGMVSVTQGFLLKGTGRKGGRGGGREGGKEGRRLITDHHQYVILL